MLTLLMAVHDSSEWGVDAPAAFALPLTNAVLVTLKSDLEQVKLFSGRCRRLRSVEFSDRWGQWVDGKDFEELLDDEDMVVVDTEINDDAIHLGLDLPTYSICDLGHITFKVYTKHGGDEYYTGDVDWDWLMKEINEREKERLC